MLEGDRKVSITIFEGYSSGGLMDAKCYLALGLGTAGVPRGFLSFRPRISDIFLGLPGVLDATAVANGSGAVRRGTDVRNARDRVWRVSRSWYALVQSMHTIKFVNCNRLMLQDL
jgi:hypothetical protein